MMKSPSPAEHEALLLCARRQLDDEQSSRLRILARQKLDWDYLYKLARRHSLVPLFYYQIERVAGEAVPAPVLQRLRKDYQENSARNSILTNEMVSIIRELEVKGIEAIPYKGPALALAAYDNPALRRYIDLDLMVRKSDVSAASDLLIARGYQPARNLDQRQQALLLTSQHNIQFSRDEGRLIVELHWRVATQLFAASVSAEDLWPNLVTVELGNASLKTLSIEDLLFCLCVHGSRHLWERLSWICDVAALITACPTIDWPQLVQRAQRTDTERMLFLGLHLANRLVGASLPKEIETRVADDSSVLALTDAITERLFNGTVQVPPTPREIFKYNFSVRKSWKSRARYCLSTLRPSDSDLGTISLPRFLGFGYYVLRPFRLFTQNRSVKPISENSGRPTANSQLLR
jgi:hypothetical protein